MACKVRLCLVWFSPRGAGGRRGGGGGGPPSAWNSVRSIDHCDCRFHTANGTGWIFMVVHHTVSRFVKVPRKTIFILFFTVRSQIILTHFPFSL
jgi:hypothetical protein